MKAKNPSNNILKKTIHVIICITMLLTSTGFKVKANDIAATNLVQNALLGISSPLYEGGKVYFTVTIKNTGTTTSPNFHPYVEGYTANSQLFRADGASPSTYKLSPGSSITFKTNHDLWYGHSGTWSTYGVYLWNDDTDSYYGQLNSNGYSQSKTFNVLGCNDIRQNGSISISGNTTEGGVVYLDIPIKNFGTATSMAMHVYTEGYTSQSKLWRADGAQPTAIQLAPGQSTTIRVKHDIWYGHAGTWTTYGVYIWNDYNNTYFATLNANGYDQSLSFITSEEPIQSLDIQYLEDANKAIDIGYEVISLNSDRSITVDLTVKNKTWIPLIWDLTNVGYVTDRDNTIHNIANLSFFIFPPRTTKTIEQVVFPANSQLTFLYAKQGFNEYQYDMLVIVGGLLFLYTDITGDFPTGDDFEDTTTMVSTISEGLWDIALKDELATALATVGTKWALKDYKGAWETVLLEVELWAKTFEKISGYLFKESLVKTKIISAIYTLGLITHFYNMARFLDDVIRAPLNPVVKIVPSTRPVDNGRVASDSVEKEIQNEFIPQLNAELIAITSEHSEGFNPDLILDGNISTGWTSAMGEEGLESINLRLSNNRPAVLTSLKINPGPILNDQQASAVKEIEIYTSLNGIDYNHLITGSFSESELLTLKSFTFTPRLAEYIKINITENQSENAVKYMDFGDILIFGKPISSNDIYEPDSKSEIARELRKDGVNEDHNINYQDDNDWFYFYGNEGDNVKLALSTLQSDLGIKLEVYQPDGNIIFLHNQTPGLTAVFNATLTQTGIFLIRIYLSGNYGDVYKFATNYTIGLTGGKTNIFLPIIIN